MPKTDVVVLGAGIVGVSAALHLQARGRDVVLLDRCAGAGLETSFGNAGLIERSSIYPYFFPRDPLRLVKYAFNLLPEAHYHFSALPQVGPWLWRYFRAAGSIRPVFGRQSYVQPAAKGAFIQSCIQSCSFRLPFLRRGLYL